MSRLAYRVGVVAFAALLTGPVLAEDEHQQASGVSNYDGSAYPGDGEDRSVIDPDGGADDADGGDEDNSQDDGGDNSPDTYPA